MNDVQTQLSVVVIAAVIMALMYFVSRSVRSFQIRLWLYGWVMLFLYSVAATAAVPPIKGTWLLVVVTVHVVTLGLAATAFLIAAMERYQSVMRRRLAATVAVPWVAFTVGNIWHWGGNPLLYVCTVVGFFGSAMLAAFSSSLPGRSYKLLSAVLLACGGAGAIYGVSQGKPDLAINMALATLFTQAAIMTWQESSRAGAGVITTTIALCACGATFPLFIVTYKLGFTLHYHYVVRDIPKLFLAFGMLLAIMEKERASAVAAGNRFRAFFDQSQEGIVIFRPDTETILEANPCACAMYGVSRAQLVGSSLVDITKDPAAGVRELMRVAETGGTTDFATTHFRADGSEINILASGRLIEYEGGPAVLGQMRDITERKRVEETQTWLASFPKLNPNPVVEVDLTGRISFLNPATERLFPDIASRGCAHPWLAGLEDMVRACRASANGECVREVLIGEAWYHQFAFFVSSAQHLRLYGFNITDRKRAEEALRQSEERFRQLAETTLDAVLVAQDGSNVYANAAAARMLRAAGPEELVGRDVFALVAPEHREAAQQRMQRTLAGEKQVSFEECFVRLDGSFVQVEITASPLTWQGRPALQAVVRDITERKRAEESKRALAARILRLHDEERRRIARELHDTTAQNLAGLCLNLSLLSRSAALWSDKERESLATCRNIADQSLSELRTVSYLLHPPLLEELGLEPALKWFVEGFNKRSGIRVSLDLAAGLTRLPRDVELTLFRIVQESLGNVHRHSGSKVATVRIRQESGVVLEVEDEGFGMAQNWEATLRTIAHQGVGIAGMRERIHELGGELRISPRKPKGTIVRAVIPLQEVVHEATGLDS